MMGWTCQVETIFCWQKTLAGSDDFAFSLVEKCENKILFALECNFFVICCGPTALQSYQIA